MFLKKSMIFVLLIIYSSKSQNILNLLDFAAPLFGLLKAGTHEVCYEELGCFRNDDEFSPSPHRPISCVPQSPQIIGTEFLFYSRKHTNDPKIIEALDSHLFTEIEFNPRLSTKVVIHGYKEGPLLHGFSHDSFEVIKDGILYNEDSNVILVRWSRGSSGFYFQSVANTRVVAAQIALLIKYLITERKGRSELFHLIGFSLGSHIAGYVGKLIPNLGRITALDTAKPYFDGMPPRVRLDVSDALYIDAIHTDNDIGSAQRSGHLDLYINGGNLQPGCDREVLDRIANDGLIDGLLDKISCDHKRAVDYYIDYLFNTNTACLQIAYSCESWDRFMSGQCWSCGQTGEGCAVIGLNTESNKLFNGRKLRKNNYYILTNDRQPYCGECDNWVHKRSVF